jgi:UDP-N-acetylmuramate dehydrogenase
MSLPKSFKNKLKTGVSLIERTSFCIGGRAKYWYEPKSRGELSQFLKGRDEALPIFVIGAGSNLLVKEGLIRKVFIHLSAPEFQKIEVSGSKVTVGAGVKIGRLIFSLSAKNLSGYEFLAGIPGTIGGALAMNAGARSDFSTPSSYREMKDIVSWVEVFNEGAELIRFSGQDIALRYRDSGLRGFVILAVGLKLEGEDKGVVQKRLKALLAARIERQDWRYPSAGSFFKNPPDGPPAGRLIDQCGLKGFKVGGAQVSDRHANFIINVEKAKSRDVLKLMEIVSKKVYNRFNIELSPEVQIVS